MNYPYSDKEISEYLKKQSELYLPNVYVNTVIFSYHNEKLNTLILRFDDSSFFMLSGGNIMKHEDIDEAARKSLKDRVDIEDIYLEQFYTSEKFIEPNRETVNMFTKKLGEQFANYYLKERTIRVCYYALIDENKLKPATKDMSIVEFKWVNVHEVPELLFDHSTIIQKAKEKLQDDLDKKLPQLGKGLMNETFTMNELQKLYEAVYDKEFTRTNFQRRMLNLDILERLEKQYNGKSHKAPYLYKFKDL